MLSNETLKKINCNNDTYEYDFLEKNELNKNFWKQYKRSLEYSSIINHKKNNNKCIMEFKHVDFLIKQIEKKFNNKGILK